MAMNESRKREAIVVLEIALTCFQGFALADALAQSNPDPDDLVEMQTTACQEQILPLPEPKPSVRTPMGCPLIPQGSPATVQANSGHEAALIFSRTCGRCHGLPDPSLHQPGDWNAVVKRMLEKMERHHLSPPNAAERAAILDYLQAPAEKD